MIPGTAKSSISPRPVRIDNEGCLQCHSTPDRAPAAMLAKYGATNGFGWVMGETVGVEMLTVPLTEPLRGLLQVLAILGGGLLIMFSVAYAAIAVALDRGLVRPLVALANSADA